MSENEKWRQYIEYLHEWADLHSDPAFMFGSPACYEEWVENEGECDD